MDGSCSRSLFLVVQRSTRSQASSACRPKLESTHLLRTLSQGHHLDYWMRGMSSIQDDKGKTVFSHSTGNTFANEIMEHAHLTFCLCLSILLCLDSLLTKNQHKQSKGIPKKGNHKNSCQSTTSIVNVTDEKLRG